MIRNLLIAVTMAWVFSVPIALAGAGGPDGLAWTFTRGYGQVEVGGPYAGAEFHESRPLPSRISFYYPVANSIDLSTDYWRRGESRPLAIGVQINGGPKRWIGKTPWTYTVSPHRVTFEQHEKGIAHALTYEFFRQAPGMVMRYVLRNKTSHPVQVEVYTHLRTVLRTCQTYARLDSAWTEVDTLTRSLLAHFDRIDADRATVFVQNLAEVPGLITSDAEDLAVADSGWSRWIDEEVEEPRFHPVGDPGPPVAAFIYRRLLASRDSLVVVQAIGSCRRPEVPAVTGRLRQGWREDAAAQDGAVREGVALGAGLRAGDRGVDLSSVYALGILASNAHYLDSAIVPMPCPAEYNFFFTHDVLLTDLHAVHFSPERVRKDLGYIAAHAKDSIIPHAYYWKDGAYVTEWCTPDNWNHLWFVQVVAAYLRHTGDTSTVRMLLPLVQKSLAEVLTQKEEDGLMHAFRPDWWDIGRNKGPRAYMSILTIRALRDYLFLGSSLALLSGELQEYETVADGMQNALVQRLWDDSTGYLTNYNGAQQDQHYYMGSLLGSVFGLLDTSRAARLVETAERFLLEPKVGVRTVWPVDFNTDSVRAFFKFVGNEAGDPYVYANGGIWPHCNAWYATALMACGRADDAYRFFKTTMTLPGVINSPNGQPAMYEYRNSNPSAPEFGRIDKPSFLWAAGFYLGTLYRLLGLEEGNWNLSVGGSIPLVVASSEYPLVFGRRKQVIQSGMGDGIASVRVDNAALPSRCLPRSLRGAARIGITRGRVSAPYLEGVNAILDSVVSTKGRTGLRIVVRSFDGHKVQTIVRSPGAPRVILVDGKTVVDVDRSRMNDGSFRIIVRHAGSRKPQIMQLFF